MPSSRSMNRELAKAFLEISEGDWQTLVRRGLARELTNFIPFVIEFQDNLEDAKKFFTEMKELEVVPPLDEQLEALDKCRLGITAVSSDESLGDKEAKQLLAEAHDDLAKAFTEYAKLEAATVEVIRTKSHPKPKQAKLIEKVRSYWNHIDDFWPNEREAVLGKWRDYFEKTNTLLRKAASSLQLPNSSPSGTLLRVESLLKKRSAPFLAQKVADARNDIKQYYVEEYGLIPAYMGAKGNWKVEKDDCPEPKNPDYHTKLTDRFAFCRVGKESCPAFDWSMGSYVRCKSFTRLKEAGLISGISKLDDKDYVEDLKKLAETDPFLQMLFHNANRSDGSLFWGKTVDDRLETMLAQYPKSDRKGNQGVYRVYLVANEPVFVSGGHAVAADRVLLETIGEGVRMPTRTATTTRVAGPMIRLTFTANALRDPEFRDYLRKKKAVNSRHWTWDIPFEKEDDIAFTLSEIKEEFGYPIIVMEIVEDIENRIYRNFGLRELGKLPILRHSSALLYIPRVARSEVRLGTVNLSVSEKLVDVANNLDDGDLKTRVAGLADNLRVGRHFLILTPQDMIRYKDGAVGVVPEPGMTFRVKDPDTGSMVQTEVTEVVRQKKGAPTYKVRTIDTGKEISLDHGAFLNACGCGGPGPDMAPDMGPSAPPGLAHFPGGDGQVFLFRLPKKQEEMAPPPPAPMGYGRFPGEGSPEPMAPPPMMAPMPPPLEPGPPMMGPPLKFTPLPPSPSAPPSGGPLPFGPGGSPFSDVPAPPPPHGPPPPVVMGPPPGKEEHGPIKQTTQVFAPVDPPEQDEDVEQKVIDQIKKKVKPGLKFTNLPRDPIAPSGASEEEVDQAVKKLRDKLKGNPSVKDVRRDLSPHGKPVLFVHTTSPKSLEGKLPDSVNGFEVRVSPLHNSLADEIDSSDREAEEDSDREAGDSLVAPSPDRPENGDSKGREHGPTPYMNQVSGPPPMGDELNRQNRDIPKY